MSVNYHRHSMLSNPSTIDSTVSNKTYCERAVELKQGIISSCEHGTKGNIWQVSELAEEYKLKWRYVAEAYWVKDRFVSDRTNAHIILAAKTAKGVGDLNDLLSEANETGFYGHPRVDLSLLMQLDPNDVFLTTACMQFFKYDWVKDESGHITIPSFVETDEIIRQLASRFKKSMLFEVQPHNDENQRRINEHLLQLSRQYGIGLIAGLDSHYIYPKQKDDRQILLESKGMKYENEDEMLLDYPDDEEIYRRFQEQGVLPLNFIKEAIDATNIFYDFEDVKLPRGSLPVAPKYMQYSQEERNKIYSDLVWEKWGEFKIGVPPERWDEYEADIQYEVDTITSTNVSDYFLIDYELVQEGLKRGGKLTKTGRGSGSSWFTNTLLGFSSIDRHLFSIPLLPDRFISADRLGAGLFPDLDLNVADQKPFADAQAYVMGPNHSFRMINYGTYARAGAWQMYCRAQHVPYEISRAVSDNLKEYEKAVKYAEDDEKDLIDVHDYVPKEYWEYVDASTEYMGIVVQSGIAACSYILSNTDLRREIGLVRRQDRSTGEYFLCAEIDGKTAEKWGYVKNDLIGRPISKDSGVSLAKLLERLKALTPIRSESRNKGLRMAYGENPTCYDNR